VKVTLLKTTWWRRRWAAPFGCHAGLTFCLELVELYLVEHELKWAKAASLELWIHGYIHMSTNNALWCAKPLVRVSRGGGVFGRSGFTKRFHGGSGGSNRVG